MKIYYSSMFIREDIDSIHDLVRLANKDKIKLCLDTNICIYIRELYNDPYGIYKRKNNILDELFKFLKDVEYHDLEVDFLYGCEEASRTLDVFNINQDKLEEIIVNINNVLNMSNNQLLQFLYSNKVSSQCMDYSKRTDSKIQSLERPSSFKNILTLNYACLLQLYIQKMKYPDLDNVNQMIKYIDFLNTKIDMISASNLIFGYYYFSTDSIIKKMIHTKKKEVEHKIHAIWNASIDLTLPILVSRKFIEEDVIPVFVTADVGIFTLFNSMKIKCIFGDRVSTPPLVEINLEKLPWKTNNITLLDNYFNSIQKGRIQKLYYNNWNLHDIIIKNMNLCKELEDEAKKYM